MTDTHGGLTPGYCTVRVLGPEDIRLVVGASPTGTVGIPLDITVSARERFGDLVPYFPATLHFTCTDRNAFLPADYTFARGDGGYYTFTKGVTFPTPGQWTITAATRQGTALPGSVTVTVKPALRKSK